jgi:pimeloyl-ACP methyl ester carboxylesterase
MKPYLFILFCCLSLRSVGQNTLDSVHSGNVKTKLVKFNSAGVTLEGSIFIPKHTIAALVLVHGSGQETRMVGVASLLAESGIAVITYDKRGVGKSGGTYAGPEVGTNNVDPSNLNLLALDASAATEEILVHLKTNHIPVGLMGFSQAAWVIPLAAKKNPNVKFITLFSGPVVTTLEQLRFQFYTNGNSQFWETHSEADAREHISNDPDKYHFAPTDPRETLSLLSIPALWLFGGKDIQAPVGLSIERIDALKARGKPYSYKLFPELGHNTSSSKSKEPFNFAIQWIKSISSRTDIFKDQ